MTAYAKSLSSIGESIDKIRQLFQENPAEAQRLLHERPEMLARIQEIVVLLKDVQEAVEESASVAQHASA